MYEYFEIECPECGSTDVDINPKAGAPDWQCCECGAEFDLDMED